MKRKKECVWNSSKRYRSGRKRDNILHLSLNTKLPHLFKNCKCFLFQWKKEREDNESKMRKRNSKWEWFCGVYLRILCKYLLWRGHITYLKKIDPFHMFLSASVFTTSYQSWACSHQRELSSVSLSDLLNFSAFQNSQCSNYIKIISP